MIAFLIVVGCSNDEPIGSSSDGAAGSSDAKGGASGGSVATGGNATGAVGTGGTDASSGGGTAGAGATGGTATDAGDAAGSAGAESDAGDTDVCTPSVCGGIECGPLSDGCGGSLLCPCYGPSSCVSGTCTEVAASFCGPTCGGEFTVLVKTVASGPCVPCSAGGSPMTFCTKPGTTMIMVNDGVCPAAHHFTQSFKDCDGTWWYGCIPN
jgi:hypothetical protein